MFGFQPEVFLLLRDPAVLFSLEGGSSALASGVSPTSVTELSGTEPDADAEPVVASRIEHPKVFTNFVFNCDSLVSISVEASSSRASQRAPLCFVRTVTSSVVT